jgi:hypothetical protein
MANLVCLSERNSLNMRISLNKKCINAKYIKFSRRGILKGKNTNVYRLILVYRA